MAEFLEEDYQPKTPVFYALYNFNGNSLALLISSLDMNQEAQLRLFLTRRLSKGTVFPNTGNIASMDFSLAEGADSPANCYYILLSQQLDSSSSSFKPNKQNNHKYIFCLLTVVDGILEHFREELGTFCEGLLAKHDPMESKDQLSLERHLAEWYTSCIEYITRVVDALGEDVAYLLYLALNQVEELDVKCNNLLLKEDILRFYDISIIHEFIPEAKKRNSKKKPVTIVVNSPGKLVSDDLVCNDYCQEWGIALSEEHSDEKPHRLKKVLEDFKLQTIGDMNTLKRLINDAETDHYALYRAYSFLKKSGNEHILLKYGKWEKGCDSSVTKVLEECVLQST